MNRYHILFVSLIIIISISSKAQTGWEILNSNTTVNLKSIHFPVPDTGYVAGNSALLLKTTDAGLDWTILPHPFLFSFNDIFFFNADEGLAVGESGFIIRTSDGGTSWILIPTGVSDELLSVAFFDSFGICTARSQTILYTTNRGISWEIAQSGYVGGGFWGAVLLSQQIGFIGGENSIFQPLVGKTFDGGVNWDFTAFYLNNNEGRLTGIEFTDAFIGYASARVWDGRGTIAKTTDGGINWNTIFFNNVLNAIDFPISNASLVGYTSGDSGKIYKTYDAGINWNEQISGTDYRLNKIYFLDLDVGYIAGDNGTILKTTTGGEPVTSYEEQINNSTDFYSFKLFQNYPNPFNPGTTINYQVAEKSFVTLKIYNILGDEITTLVNKVLSKGRYECKFDASNLSSGIYFYQLKSNNKILTGKMVILK